MTDLISVSQEAQMYSGDPAHEASYGASRNDSDHSHTGRHRAAEEPEDQGVQDPAAPAPAAELLVVGSPDPLPLPTVLATLLPGGVGAAAFHAAIHAARTSVSRQPIERSGDGRTAGTGHGQPTNPAVT